MKKGFTLIELLAVMGIMMMMSAIAVVSYFGMTRGSAMRGAVSHLRSTLHLARQTAIMQGKKTYVIFNQNTTNAWYVLCRQEGIVTLAGSECMGDKYADMSGWVNWRIYRLGSIPVSATIDYYQPDPPIVGTPDIDWSAGDKYGWEIHPKTYLPHGYQFGDGDEPNIPEMIVFNADGTTRVEGYKEPPIEIFESIHRESSDPHAEITVAGLTGFVSVKL